MPQFFDFENMPEFAKSCLALDYYKRKVASHAGGTSRLLTFLTPILLGDEQTYFKKELNYCKDNYGKSICYLIRGMAAQMCSNFQAAIVDYNHMISLLDVSNPNQILTIWVAYYNRAYAYTKLDQYANAVADYDTLIKLLPPTIEKSDQTFAVNFIDIKYYRLLASIKKDIAESNFDEAKTRVIIASTGGYPLNSIIKMMLDKFFFQTLNLIFKIDNSQLLFEIKQCLIREDSPTSFPGIDDYLNIRTVYLELIKQIWARKKVLNISFIYGMLDNQQQIDDIVKAISAGGITVQGLAVASSSTLVIKSLSAQPPKPKATKKVLVTKLENNEPQDEIEFPDILPAAEQSVTSGLSLTR